MGTLAPDIQARSLEAYFIGRKDLIARWGMTISSFQTIPGLVGFWPMSSVARNTGNAFDISGQDLLVSYNGNPIYNIYNSFVPYLDFDGTGDFLSRADEGRLQILGTETIYASAVRGLTIGGWFWMDGAGATDGLMGKWTESGDERSYLLLTLSDTYRFAISNDGTASTQFSHTSTFSTGQWYFVVGKYEPSVRMSVFMNGEKASTTTSIPASIFNSTAAFQVGAYNAGTQNLDGRASLCFLSANALPDALIDALFTQSRPLFNV